MGFLEKISVALKKPGLRPRGMELTGNPRSQSVEMVDHGKRYDKAPLKGSKAETPSNTQNGPGDPRRNLGSGRSPEDDALGVLHPNEVGLRRLSDKKDSEFSSLALEADPAWEHIDPAAFRSFVSSQEWPRQLYMTHCCDIVYCR